MNRKNLRKLATYLGNLPRNYDAFEMEIFFSGTSREAENEYAERNGGVGACGAVACAVGHGPSAGILFPPASEESELWILSNHNPLPELIPDWTEYSKLNFINNSENPGEWEWCFGGGWTHVDNTPQGAAARIRWLLAGNTPPEIDDYDEDMRPFQSCEATREHVEMYSGF